MQRVQGYMPADCVREETVARYLPEPWAGPSSGRQSGLVLRLGFTDQLGDLMGFRSKSALVLVTAGVLMAASPASAFWQCTAKNAHGMKFTAMSLSLVTAVAKQRASERALAKCAAVSAVCKVTKCVDFFPFPLK